MLCVGATYVLKSAGSHEICRQVGVYPTCVCPYIAHSVYIHTYILSMHDLVVCAR